MASNPCTVQLTFASKSCNSSFSSCGSTPCSSKLNSQFLGVKQSLGWFTPSRIGPSSGSIATCWFKFGKNGVDAEGAGNYGSQTRVDFDRDDVEQVTYDKMEALLSQNIHPVDILLMMAASEGDKPKIEELLRAGASYTVKDTDGKTALDKAVNEEMKDFMLGFSVQKL